MIRNIVGRSVSSGVRAARPSMASLVRFQSQSSGVTEQPVEATPVTANERRDAKQYKKGSQNHGKNARRTGFYNPKLRDIVFQIKSSIEGPKSEELAEAYKIFEEGLIYLRQVQAAEGIPEDALFEAFQAPSLALFTKIEQAHNHALLRQALDLLVEHNVAHSFHFAHAMAAQLAAEEGSTHNEALSLWIRYLEYAIGQPMCTKYVRAFANTNQFYRNDVVHLAFYAYVQSLMEQGIKFDPQVAYRVLQTEELPSVYYVGQAVVRYGVKSSMDEYTKSFGNAIDAINIESTDPNGPAVIGRIVQAVERRNARGVTQAYEQIVEASTRNGKKISELTLVRVMSAYAELAEFERVLAVFQDMIQSGVSKPLTYAWETVLLAMCHPLRTAGRRGAQQSTHETAQKLEQCLATMEQNGNKMLAKTLAIVVGCYANLNQFEKADELLLQQGRWAKVPVVHLARNNYLNGLILNQRVASAELKLREFQKHDASFVPSILVLNSFLNHYVATKNFDAVDGILKYIKDEHIAVDLATYTILIDMHFKTSREMGQVASIEAIFDLISDAAANNIKLNEVTMGTLIDGLSKDGSNLEAARVLFQYVRDKMRLTPHLTTSMLETELEFGSLDELRKLFELYIKQFYNTDRVWNLMIRGLLKKEESLAVEYFEKFRTQKDGPKPNHFTYYFMMNHFLNKDNKEVVQSLINHLNNGELKNLGTQIPKLLIRCKNQYDVSIVLRSLNQHE